MLYTHPCLVYGTPARSSDSSTVWSSSDEQEIKGLTMSGPLSSLSKAGKRRAPLSGHGGPRVLPFRVPSESDQALFDRVTGTDPMDVISGQLAQHPLLSAAVTDSDLVSAMLQRLTSLERQLELAKSELQEKEGMIGRLRGQISVLEAREQPGPTIAGGSSGVEMQRQYVTLQRRLHEMETFLADYGLIWVGAEDEELEQEQEVKDVRAEDESMVTATSEALEVSKRRVWHPAEASPPAAVDFDRILRHIAELNCLAGEGIGAITTDKDGASRVKVSCNPARLIICVSWMKASLTFLCNGH